VLLLEPRLFRLEPGLRQGAEVRLGEGIAQPVL
jgi:hypothetical protein